MPRHASKHDQIPDGDLVASNLGVAVGFRRRCVPVQQAATLRKPESCLAILHASQATTGLLTAQSFRLHSVVLLATQIPSQQEQDRLQWSAPNHGRLPPERGQRLPSDEPQDKASHQGLQLRVRRRHSRS